MIRNKSQYRKAKENLAAYSSLIEKEINHLKEEGRHEVEIEMRANIMNAQMEKMRLEISEYDELFKHKEIVVNNIFELPKAIVKARLKTDLTQSDLAKKIEVAEQQIQRYEAQDYNKANLERVVQILDAMDVNVSIVLTPQVETRIINLNSIGVQPDNLIKRKKTIFNEHSLMVMGD